MTIGEIEGFVLEALVGFMYGKLKVISKTLAVPLLVAADAHQVTSLQQMCLPYIISYLDSSYIFRCVEAADKINDTELMQACLDWWAGQADSAKIVKEPAMQDMMQSNPQLAQMLPVDVMSRTSKKQKVENS